MGNCRQYVLGVLLSFAMVSQAFALGASGITTQLVGVKALGQGNTFAAQADDPSALYYNPAGITQLSGTQLTLGTELLLPFAERTGDGVPEDQMRRQVSALPMFYVTHSMKLANDHVLSYGVGLNSPFGLTTDWAPTSSVRYTSTHSAFEMVNVNPTLAYQVLSNLSIGGGIDYVNVMNITSDSMINQGAVAPGASDGTSHLSGHGSGWGYNAGILYKPVERHSLGLAYRSQIQVPIKGSLELKNLDPTIQAAFNFAAADYATDATSSFILPQSVLGGYSYHPNDQWTFLVDYEWTQWNVFQDQNVAVSETDPSRLALITGNGSQQTTIARQWHNVSAFGGGVNYKINDGWQVRGGYAYYEKTVPNDTFSPDIPDASNHLISAGVTRTMGSFVIDGAFTAFIYAHRDVNNTVGNAQGGSVNGTYKDFIPGLALSLTYKF